MRRLVPLAWAAFFTAGCAGAPPVRPDLEPLHAEIRALRAENEALAARLEALSRRVDLLTVRGSEASRPQPAAAREGGAEAPRPEAEAAAPVVPPDLAVVKISPDPRAARTASRPGARPARVPPPVPTAVPIRDPEPSRLEALARSDRRPLAAEAEQELRQARALAGLDRAHALEDFAARYPQHPSADNALVEAATAYAGEGREDAACSLARRVVAEYPAGDAMSDALERLALCEERSGAAESAERLWARLRTDFPGTPAAQRAEARLTQDPGRSDETPPRASARSGP
ncbi:MAG TPA: tetratricopeptide repeat protein [Anaeromyxobacter sp.]|nr:tetratricopeptide repeat protein [Anaeromyxobacter sp.]